MSELSIEDLAKAMGKIDFATRTDGGQLATRPMSNNGDVEYDGDSFYFTCDTARMVRDIAADPLVALSFQAKGGLLGKPPLFVAVEGNASMVRDKTTFAGHWTSDLEHWFPDGAAQGAAHQLLDTASNGAELLASAGAAVCAAVWMAPPAVPAKPR